MAFNNHGLLSITLILSLTMVEAATIFNMGTTTSLNRTSFPEGFIFGTSSSAYQVSQA